MNKFLKDLEKELQKLNVNPKEIKEILEDHKEMIEAAREEGLNEDELGLKFGDPVKVANEIHGDLKTEPSNYSSDEVESTVKYNLNDYDLVKTFTSVFDVKQFDISLVSVDFVMSDYEGDSIQVYQKEIKDIEKYEINFLDSKFTLNRKSSINFGRKLFKNNGGSFLVLIPKGIEAKIINYKTVSGDLELNGLNVNKSNFKGTSGDMEISNVSLGTAKFSLVNGDVEIQGFKADSFEISLVNGDIELEKGIIEKDIFVNSVSGDVELLEVECKTASFNTVSGDIEGRNFYVEDIKFKSVSGDVEIENDDKNRVINIVSKKTLSGDVNIK
jgi:DUF4097 and DUF4098 domain-containing protein YvlB